VLILLRAKVAGQPFVEGLKVSYQAFLPSVL
jgi:hypothetical protein